MGKLLYDNLGYKLTAPFQRFISQEKSGVIALGLGVIVAMILANSSWSEQYTHFFEHKIGFVINGNEYLYYTLHHWINDGMMSMFFFVVGLELKREFIGGELANIRNAILPIAAAVAGMIFPAIIYLTINSGSDAANGWGVPMATDIAFSLAILGLLGSKVPTQAKVFLTTLAIVDDLGAVLVIALFYTSEISLTNIALGTAFLGVMFIANKIGVKNVIFYGIIGIGGAWLAFLMSGIHATIAAVLAAFMIPADSRLQEDAYISRARNLLSRFGRLKPNNVSTLEEEQVEIIGSVIGDSIAAIPPSQRLEHALHPIVSFVIMPIFALANAGISFTGMSLPADLLSSIALGVALGLLIGKPLGIALFSLLLAKLGFVKPSPTLTVRRLTGLGFLASIGFTMSMFISTLAFKSPEQLTQAKAGIFLASIFGGLIGYWLLNYKSTTSRSSGTTTLPLNER